jgi:hypothetical protein
LDGQQCGAQCVPARRPDNAEERFLSTVQHLASVLRAFGYEEAVLGALGELLERAARQRSSGATDDVSRPKGRGAMTTTGPTNQVPDHTELPPAPFVEICVDLAPGLQVRADRCLGDVPLLEFITGRTRLIVSLDVGDARLLGPEHLALVDEFAAAACALRNEVGELVATRTQPR